MAGALAVGRRQGSETLVQEAVAFALTLERLLAVGQIPDRQGEVYGR